MLLKDNRKDKRPTERRTTPFVSARDVRTGLLDFDCCASFGELLFDVFGFVFRNAFFDRFRRAFDQVLGFLQSKAGNFANGFDDADLVAAYCSEDDSELGLFFSRCCRGAACSGSCTRNRDGGCSCADAESFFQALDELRSFEQRQSLDLFNNACDLIRHWLSPNVIKTVYSWNFFCSTACPITTARLRATPFNATAIRCAGELIRKRSLAISSSLEGIAAIFAMSPILTTRPSTIPALKTKSGFVFA